MIAREEDLQANEGKGIEKERKKVVPGQASPSAVSVFGGRPVTVSERCFG